MYNFRFMKNLKERFKKKNPELIKLNPEIQIAEINTDRNGRKRKPVYWIYVEHDFIFDNRLIPKKLGKYKVQNRILDNTIPKNIFSAPAYRPFPGWQYQNPDRYRKFVNKNLPLIQKTLKKPIMSETEALDAITGDFKKHCQRNERIKKDWIKNECGKKIQWGGKYYTHGFDSKGNLHCYLIK